MGRLTSGKRAALWIAIALAVSLLVILAAMPGLWIKTVDHYFCRLCGTERVVVTKSYFGLVKLTDAVNIEPSLGVFGSRGTLHQMMTDDRCEHEFEYAGGMLYDRIPVLGTVCCGDMAAAHAGLRMRSRLNRLAFEMVGSLPGVPAEKKAEYEHLIGQLQRELETHKPKRPPLARGAL